jgi:uncharacterized membrane protein YgcG
VSEDSPATALAAPDTQVFRSPVAAAIWWVWLVFAAANLVDLAVQGRDHLAIVAALVLVFITAVVYATARRPRLTAGADGLTIVNPITEHRVDWAAVAGADPTDLLRVRCQWPGGNRDLYAWSVHSSRRRQVSADLRAQRQRGARAAGRGAGGFGAWSGGGGRGLGWSGGLGTAPDPSTEPDPLRLDASRVVASITERAAQARRDEPDATATAPVSTWHWPTIVAIAGSGIALLIVLLA